jgi:two-component system, cell cycle sensor histidine kinase and response regulator CckA
MLLVIDDEAAIREAVRDILALANIPTLLASNGRDGMKLFAEHRSDVKAILLDMRMPVMSGLETYRALRILDPTVKIILSTGYDDAEQNNELHGDRAVFFLSKPYSVEVLIDRVQSILA